MQRFRADLQRRNYAAHTVDSYLLDLDLFCQDGDCPLSQLSFRDVDRVSDQQHAQGLTSATITRRLYALKHFCDFLIEPRVISLNPVQPSHMLRRGRLLPKPLAQAPLERLFARIQQPLDRALFLLRLRCGLRGSEVAHLKGRDLDWTQHTLRIEQGKGRKERYVYLSADALASLRECLQRRPAGVPGDLVFWNQQRSSWTLSVKAIPKKMARYATAAGIAASCHRLRHPFASHRREQGAEVVSIRELLGHAAITSSERYAKISNQTVKQASLRTMRKVLQQNKV